MAVKTTTDQTFEQDTQQGVVLIDFWATWCGPCRMQSPVVEALSEQMPNVAFYKMDVDENPATPQQFRIMSIPTLMIKKDGQVVDQLIGYHSACCRSAAGADCCLQPAYEEPEGAPSQKHPPGAPTSWRSRQWRTCLL